jgi:hypothetical protein
MGKSKPILVLIQVTLLILLCLNVHQATGEEAEVQTYGNHVANYQVGHATITEKGYLTESAQGLIPTTANLAQYTYEIVVERVLLSGDMTAMGSMAACGRGITSSFCQTHTLDVSAQGKFENCPDKPVLGRYTGTQTFSAQTDPTYSNGEVKGYGDQGAAYTVSCVSSTVKPIGNNGAQDNNNSSGSSSQGNNSAPRNGRIVTTMQVYSHSSSYPASGVGVTGTFSQTHSLQLSPDASLVSSSVTGTSTCTATQTSNVTTSK